MKKLWSGNLGLAASYWIYGLLIPSVLALGIHLLGFTLVPGSIPAILFGTAVIGYSIFWGVGTWRAASKYQGLKLWSVLAKIHIAAPLTVTLLVVVFLAVKGTVSDSQDRTTLPTPITPPQASQATINVPVETAAPFTASTGISGQPNAAPPLKDTRWQEARKKLPHLADLSDESFLNVVHDVYYQGMAKSELASKLGYTPPPPPPKLSWLDQKRYESCQKDAAKAPTPQGVNVGLQLCRDSFNQ